MKLTKAAEKVLSGALLLGDCDRLKAVRNMEDLVELFFSPQGREFCLVNNYPTLSQWRTLPAKKHGVIVDSKVSYENKSVVLVHSEAHLRFSEPKLYNVTLLHGSKAQIEAVGFAVVNIEGEGAGVIKDSTAVVVENGKTLKKSTLSL